MNPPCLLFPSGEALRCYTCMGSNNEDCNRQGSKSCPSYSDACAVVVGHDSESDRAFISLVLFLPTIEMCYFNVDVRICACVFNGRQAAVWRHMPVSRGSEAFKEMKSFAAPTRSISLIRTPCVHGTETTPLNNIKLIQFTNSTMHEARV